ncbi:hypothetical protein Tco_0569511 [Tanacetum coccineum]
MTQSGSGVSDVSSSGIGFNHYGLVLIFGRWATPVSFDSERCISSGIGSSLTDCSDGEVGYFLEELERASLESESPLEEVEEDLGHHGVSYET